jgi:MotA/TolQ/ExbB proton channel family
VSATAISSNVRTAYPSVSDRGPLLRWFVFTGATVFAGVVLWRYGLLEQMVASDRTYISSVICVLYVGASLHCLWRTASIAREGERELAASAIFDAAGGSATILDDGSVEGCGPLPPGLIGGHIRDLALKARTQGARRLDQTLLLRGLADRLRGSNGFGGFASDTAMKLGLLGTIIGFIIMLAPVAGLDASDKAMMKTSMGLMSGGMAVAMYTTLAGLVGSILLRVQYYMLDSATASVFSRAVRLTETRVVPALERRYDR